MYQRKKWITGNAVFLKTIC